MSSASTSGRTRPARLIVTLGPDVTRVTLEECDHPLVYGVSDVAPLAEDVDEATGVVWTSSPASLIALLRSMKKFESLAIAFHGRWSAGPAAFADPITMPGKGPGPSGRAK